jgi:hypothetical protein
MRHIAPDTSQPARDRARVAPTQPGQDGWIKPKHGHGMLRPWQQGNKLGGNKSTRYCETVRYARENSMKALHALVERLSDPDGRIVVVAANSILERAWGRAKEQKPEDQERVSIDLTALSAAELKILLDLAQSGRLRSVPSSEPDNAPPTIDGASE